MITKITIKSQIHSPGAQKLIVRFQKKRSRAAETLQKGFGILQVMKRDHGWYMIFLIRG